ncbi:hypothetical protein Bca52824_017767 [Brassica carinata]|uniref:20 kDa chaperonin, chloroplastic n=1 Tax=Brassica carinata TaxID=52824 RepID=A0A8X7VNS8_BRACI|nr:hypothetical protein Bca52824_017767 [Brassica carinata]
MDCRNGGSTTYSITSYCVSQELSLAQSFECQSFGEDQGGRGDWSTNHLLQVAGTELEFNDVKHLILKEDDIFGLLETEDIKDLKPLNDRVFIKVAKAEEKTAGGLFLTKTTKEKPSIGTVVAVGPGTLDEKGKRQPLPILAGSTVLYSKYAGNDFNGKDGSNYIELRCDGYLFLVFIFEGLQFVSNCGICFHKWLEHLLFFFI